MVKKQNESQPEAMGLRDLSQDQRADIDALCEDGLMPSTIGRRLGIPTATAAAARLAWQRQKDIDAPAAPVPTVTSSDPMLQLTAMMQQQMQSALLQTQLDSMQEAARHRKVSNKLEEQERVMDLRERTAQYREDYPLTDDTGDGHTDDEYDFERNPLMATKKFIQDLNTKSARPSDAISGSQSDAQPDPTKPLSDEQIAAYMARQPAKVLGQAMAAVDSPYQADLEAVLRKNAPGITDENMNRVLDWLRKQKKAVK